MGWEGAYSMRMIKHRQTGTAKSTMGEKSAGPSGTLKSKPQKARKSRACAQREHWGCYKNNCTCRCHQP